jgi:hypothetical protein
MSAARDNKMHHQGHPTYPSDQGAAHELLQERSKNLVLHFTVFEAKKKKKKGTT